MPVGDGSGLAKAGGEFVRLGSAFGQAGLGMSIVGLDGKVLGVNERLCAITGYTEAELCDGDTFHRITHPDDRPADLERRQALRAGAIGGFAVTKRYLRKDGKIIWVRFTGSRLCDADGAPTHQLRIVEDITERKRIETALAESEERLRLALEAAGMGVRELDLVTGQAYSTPQAEGSSAATMRAMPPSKTGLPTCIPTIVPTSWRAGRVPGPRRATTSITNIVSAGPTVAGAGSAPTPGSISCRAARFTPSASFRTSPSARKSSLRCAA